MTIGCAFFGFLAADTIASSKIGTGLTSAAAMTRSTPPRQLANSIGASCWRIPQSALATNREFGWCAACSAPAAMNFRPRMFEGMTAVFGN
jgi:hypothetical protein